MAGGSSDHDRLVRCRKGGVEWEIVREEAELAESELMGHVEDVESLPGTVRIKETTVRSVYRARLGDGRGAIVKVFRAPTLLRRLKERFLRSQAGTEWAALRRLAVLGIPASRPIALGRPADRSGQVQAYLVLHEELEVASASASFKSLAEAEGPAAAEAQARLLRELAAFVRRFHDAGVRHDDLHWGNILVRRDADAPGGRFVLVDLQRVGIGRPVSARQRARAIAQLLEPLRPGKAAVDAPRAVFLQAYLSAGPPLSDAALTLRAVERLIARRRERRLRSRALRCLRDSSNFAVVRTEGLRIYHSRRYSVAEILGLLEAPEGPSRAGRRGCALEVTGFPPPRGLRRLCRALTRSRAVREYAACHRRRLETRAGPRPVAAVEYLRGPRRGASVLIVETDADRDA